MSKEQNYLVLAYYKFAPIENPHQLIKDHKDFFKNRDITSRIYISEQGINGQTSGKESDIRLYMEWMHSLPSFADMPFKIHTYHENVFPRKTVKYRKQLVALDEEVNLEDAGEHLSPESWKDMLEKDRSKILLDVRNDYEWQVGRFEGADCPPCETFREFKEYAQTLKNKVDPQKTPVMMYCTGGIRCELYSALLKKEGFDKVYQLNGGIINYGLKQGNEHWMGKLFVFDDRLTVPVGEDASPVIGKCHHCQESNDSYYNCSNMDCNNLFLCCPACVEKFQGCCCTECQEAPRLRPYQHQNPHKPFRKKHHYKKEAN